MSWVAASATGDPLAPVAERLGDEPALRLLQELVSIAPTNLEDLANDRFEKPNYRRAAEAIVRWARRFGLATRVFDALTAEEAGEFHGVPRPNVIVDLDRGASETVLILAHFDVVPVPVEQRARWKSPPHTLTLRPDGRLYGRGSSDDLGSGVTASLLAMRRLGESDRLQRNVRLLACCDEETGGAGGIEALRHHDAPLGPSDPERFVRGDVALIPDGSPHTTIGSSGLAFLEAARRLPAGVADAARFGGTLVRLHDLASTWGSASRSPDWPNGGAPAPTITGRATLTRFHLETEPSAASSRLRLRGVHAETDAGNLIPRAVTLALEGEGADADKLREQFAAGVAEPFHVEVAGSTALEVPEAAVAIQVVGVAMHAGYPHRGHNPVPVALELIGRAVRDGRLEDSRVRAATYTVDLRLPPEMDLDEATRLAFADVARRAGPDAGHYELEAPPARCRPGYSLAPGHPAAVKLERIVKVELGEGGLFGEYGGTDASSLQGVLTSKGAPLPALVFGSMDPPANIHDVDESAEPRLIGAVARTIERFVLEP